MGDTNAPGSVHVHYDVYLPDGSGGDALSSWDATDNRIDPIAYWTHGLNPNATVDPYTGTPTSTGLTVLLTPINDLPAEGLNGLGDGQIATATVSGVEASENGRLVKEGQSSFLKVGVNTPHTQPIVLRLRFDQPLPGLEVRPVGTTQVTWISVGRTAYITLPATVNQSTPNTSGLIELYFAEDDNTRNEHVTYTVEAGYLSNGTFVPYNQATTVFTPVVNQSLTIIDNDLPTTATGTTLTGTEGNNASAYVEGGSWVNLLLDDGNWLLTHADYNGNGNTDAEGALTNDPIQGDLIAEAGTAVIEGLGGHDTLIGSGLPGQRLNGGAGNDLILASLSGTGQSGPGAILDGGDGHDVLVGNVGDDYLLGGNDNDFLNGQGGNDTLKGGTGQDWLNGGGGTDVLVGEGEDDRLFGGAGADSLEGGSGNDRLYGDTMVWNVIWDRATGTPQALTTGIPGSYSQVRDVAISEAGDDYLDGGAGDDRLYGGAGNDVLNGGSQNDTLEGEGGNDQLFGGSGDDTLWGDSDPYTVYTDGQYVDLGNGFVYRWRARDVGADGNDVLHGGQGNDRLFGGLGNDTYLFDRGDGQDVIGGIVHSAFVYAGNGEGGGRDLIRFGAGILPSEVTVNRSGADLVLAITGTTDSLTVRNWYSDAASQVEFVQFHDGTVWDPQALMRLARSHVAFDSATLFDDGTTDTAYGLVLGPEVANGFAVTVDDAGGTDTLALESVLLPGTPPELGPQYLVPLLEGASREGDDLVLNVFLRSDITRPEVRGTVRVIGHFASGEIETLAFPGGSYITQPGEGLAPGSYVATSGTWPLYERFELKDAPVAQSGSDYLDGGAGNDTPDGGAGNDWLDGGGTYRWLTRVDRMPQGFLMRAA